MIMLAGCVGTPSVSGVAGTAPAPNHPWTPPSTRGRAAPARTDTAAALPPDLAARVSQLTLADIVDLALRNNPATRISWENARAAAAAYGSQLGAYYPTIDGQVGATRIKTLSTQGRSAVEQTTYGPSLSISWLLLDFGGRSGAIEGARQALVAADFTHNATLQQVVLQVESAYFDYMASKALVAAQRQTVEEARANLAAAQERRRVGVATVADELQARTALSQAQLALETTEGTLLTTRGALAVSVGLPANVPYDVQPPDTTLPVSGVADSVDVLIARAVESRPDLAAAVADSAQAHARIGEIRAERLPSLSLDGTGGRTFGGPLPKTGGNSYTLTLGLRIPLFAGFSRAYNQMAAEAQARAAAARLDATRQQVIFQVFSSYYALQTATRRVRTADDLLASAQQSYDVALGRYKAGVGTVLDLLAAQSALADARAQQVQARWVWRTALSQLAHDAGVLDVHGGSPIRLAPDTTGQQPPR
ncbi:MAG TPA: TolC family protein [Gemmatimonadaceae bacterium]|nr:TolC family protein [Gemmatimonadaceae bacterium]